MFRSGPSVLLLAAGLVAQAPALVDAIEAPYAYLALQPGGDRAIHALLSDPALDGLLQGPAPASGSAQALGLVRGMFGRTTGDVELALTGIAGALGQPLLVLRVRLEPAESQRLRVVLADTSVAAPCRQLGDQQTYRLLDGTRDGAEGIGQLVELALVGEYLVVGNDGSAMRELLAPGPAVTAAAPRRVLANDPVFAGLRQRLELPAGSLLMYCDWQRLGRRLQTSLTGVPGALLASSGLGSARALMMALVPERAGLAATLLLEFEAPDAVPPPVPHRPGMRPAARTGIAGWFTAVRPVTARSLAAELPAGTLGGLVLSIDLAAIASWSPRSAHLLWDLRAAFTDFGLDFERNVLGRLAARGAVQLHLSASDATEPVVTPIYSLRARNRRVAQDLFADLRRVVEKTQTGRLVATRDKRGTDILELSGRSTRPLAYAVVFEDLLLLAADLDSLIEVHEELRQSSRPRGRRDPALAAAMHSLGDQQIAGLFDVDLQPLLQRLAGLVAGSGSPDLSGLPQRHVGYLELTPRDGGSVVRIGLLSSH